MEFPSAERLEEWFDRRLEAELDDSSEYPLLLVVLGEKPAALTMNVDDRQLELLKEFCHEFDLGIRVAEGRISKPGRTVGENERRDQEAAFICRDPERFNLLEKGRFYGYSDRSVGRFLDFPQKAIDFFAESEQPGMESRKRIEEFKHSGKVENLEYLALTTFIPAPDLGHVRESVRLGKDRERTLEHMDSVCGFELGKKMKRERMDRSFY